MSTNEEGIIPCGTVTATATATAVLDLQALPEACIASVISLTTPPDACRLSSVSRTFRSAAESDAVWSKFLPPEIPAILSPHALNGRSKSKEFYLALCDQPVLIDEGKMSFSLDKWSGKKSYMVSARDLVIVWADTPNYWKWISVPESSKNRFEEVAELVGVCWLEIRGKIDTRLLSPSTMYKAYLVFKSTAATYGFEYQPAEVSVGLVGGGEPTKQNVFLDAERGRTRSYQIVPRRVGIFHRSRILGLQAFQPREIDDKQYPKERADGWLEIELGEFFCEGGEDGELEMTCLETRGGQWKGGLIVQGIEVRPKRKS